MDGGVVVPADWMYLIYTFKGGVHGGVVDIILFLGVVDRESGFSVTREIFFAFGGTENDILKYTDPSHFQCNVFME